MSLIRPSDPDFQVCRIDLGTLIELQLQAERRGWGTRWTSVEALRGQVKEDVVLLQSFLRQEREGGVRTCRCLVLFSTVEGSEAGGVTTIDVDPEQYATLGRIDHDLDVRETFAMIFALATSGIAMISKK